MNLIASTLLLVHANEEEAFWSLTAIIEHIVPSDFFSPSLLVSRACPMVLMEFVEELLPKLYSHLSELGVDLPAICFSWFLSLLTDCLPVEVRIHHVYSSYAGSLMYLLDTFQSLGSSARRRAGCNLPYISGDPEV